MPRTIKTVRQAVTILGGSVALARKLGVPSNTPNVWVHRKTFPSNYYIRIKELLNAEGDEPSEQLFRSMARRIK